MSSVTFWLTVVATAVACFVFLLSGDDFDLAPQITGVLFVGGLSTVILWSRNRAIAAGILCGILAATAFSFLLVAFFLMNYGMGMYM